jgi:pyruvate dehydrogenase E1 component beta subunit
LSKAKIVRPGKDLTVISYSRVLNDCSAVAERLSKEGISVELLDLRTVAPFDQEMILNSVGKTRRAVIVHEAVKSFGVGAEIAACINEHLHGQLKARVSRVGAPLCPVPFSKVLEAAYLPSEATIEAAIRACL